MVTRNFPIFRPLKGAVKSMTHRIGFRQKAGNRSHKLNGVLLLIFAPLLASCGLESSSPEEIEYHNLRIQRYDWLEEGCPQPRVASKYVHLAPPDTNYTYAASLLLSNKTYHGLFATRRGGDTNTYVITTTGDFFVVEPSGRMRLLKPAVW